ncbi:hypothetical protein [Roseisolibacter agri]|uniref:hypothetical protein n=1 Tax=Roseisolibacter agri TaxID=2014610 RepID=UPI0024E04775|nr:hypothetical protein [Roseisolibacter agri]
MDRRAPGRGAPTHVERRVEPRVDGRAPLLGTSEHVGETLRRARASIAASREHRETLLALFARGSALLAASDRAIRQSQALRAELRASVTALVQHLHDDGEPPQRMLVLVKSTVAAALPPECDPSERRALMEDVVRWSIDAYYPAA